MTETEKKALALVNAVCAEWEVSPAFEDDMDGSACFAALTRAIEQHEAFRQRVSETVELAEHFASLGEPGAYDFMRRFIIPKPDPLVEVIADYKRTKGGGEYATNKDMAAALRAALAARGLKIVEAGHD